MTVQTWQVLFLGHYKWNQSNLITSCGAKALRDINLDEDVTDLNMGDCDTSES